MRAREKMLGTLCASVSPAPFEDTLFNVSVKTQRHHTQARSLEPLRRSSFTTLPSLSIWTHLAPCTLLLPLLLLNPLTVQPKSDRNAEINRSPSRK